MENLLGIHGRKTIEKFSNEQSSGKQLKITCKEIEKRKIIKNKNRIIKENIIEGFLYATLAILFFIIFVITFKKYQLITDKNDVLNHYVSSHSSFCGGSIF